KGISGAAPVGAGKGSAAYEAAHPKIETGPHRESAIDEPALVGALGDFRSLALVAELGEAAHGNRRVVIGREGHDADLAQVNGHDRPGGDGACFIPFLP